MTSGSGLEGCLGCRRVDGDAAKAFAVRFRHQPRRGNAHSWYADGAPMPDSKRRDVTPTYRQSVASISRSVAMVHDLFLTEMVHDLKRGRFNFQTLNRICCRTEHIRITRIIYRGTGQHVRDVDQEKETCRFASCSACHYRWTGCKPATYTSRATVCRQLLLMEQVSSRFVPQTD
jgi:hypothetical protein